MALSLKFQAGIVVLICRWSNTGSYLPMNARFLKTLIAYFDEIPEDDLKNLFKSSVYEVECELEEDEFKDLYGELDISVFSEAGHSIRTFWDHEIDKLGVKGAGLLLELEQKGILNAGQREAIIEMAFYLDAETLNIIDLIRIIDQCINATDGIAGYNVPGFIEASIKNQFH